MTENDKTIWIAQKVDEEYTADVLSKGMLSGKNEVIVTDHSIETIDSPQELQNALDGSFDPSNTASMEEMKEMKQDEETGIRCGKGSGFFSRTFLKNKKESDSAKRMKDDIEENSDFYNSLATETDKED